MTCLVLLVLVLVQGRAGEEEVVARLEVARCRAGCLGEQEVQEVKECWRRCEEVESQTNRVEGRRGRRLKTVLTFSSPPVLQGCELSWGVLHPAPNSSPSPSSPPALVYLVLGQEAGGPWQEVAQVVGSSFLLAPDLLARLEVLRVEAVGEGGRVVGEELQVGEGCQEGRSPAPSLLRLTPSPGHLAKASLSWPSLPAASSYLLQWHHLPSSGVVASLATSSTTATLSLEQDVTYSLQVTTLGKGGEVLHISETLVLDTRLEEGRRTDVLLLVLVICLALLAPLLRCVVRSQAEPTLELGDLEEQKMESSGILNILAKVKVILARMFRIGRKQEVVEKVVTKEFVIIC